jgi:predicted nucleic acid-binding Zn ribbon protein
MPTYDFSCCGNTVSVTNRLTETQTKTPQCGKCLGPMTRDYSFGAVKFVGSGFYSKDKGDK